MTRTKLILNLWPVPGRLAFRRIGGLLLLAATGACARDWPREPDGIASATYVGSSACASCHPAQHQAWQVSQHAVAIQEANEQTVLGQFDGRRFTSEGVTTRFFRREGKYWVNTEGPDGTLHDYQIAYTFGVYPLQQYLIPFPGGRYQALGLAWDSRPDSSGGQRWFHLYPGQRLRPGNPLHWTGIDQTWNYQCAECHSTNVQKGYDMVTGAYHTTWSELVVGCEACHGPASAHVSWAGKQVEESRRKSKAVEEGYREADVRLATVLSDSAPSTWIVDPATGKPSRSVPRTSGAEVETCGRCHARRGVLSEEYLPGMALSQTHRPAPLDEGLYHADGQMQDEVYTYGSFLQSRMYRAGVSCSDCHDPHSGSLPTDSTCARCHLPTRFATPAHHHHADGSAGASCVACHMPARTYMVVDRRHDHGFKVPRPDLSLPLGTPNACNDCHRERSTEWAARMATDWYPGLSGRASFAPALALGRRGSPEGKALLEQLVQDTTQPGIARASAVGLVAGYGGSRLASPLQLALWDRDPLVRTAGLEALERLPLAQALQMGAPLLRDSIRLVRTTAARMLAGQAAGMDPAVRARFDSVITEYRATQLVNADRPEARLNLGILAVTSGDAAGAEREYNEAIRLDSTLAAAAVNLADLYRATGRDSEAEPLLRRTVDRAPEDAGVRQALGLLLVRLGRRDEALDQLSRSATLAPENPRFALVHGVALHDLKSPNAGMAALARALERHPSDRDLLLTLVGYTREAGDLARALAYARRAASLDPGDLETRRLVRELEAMQQ